MNPFPLHSRALCSRQREPSPCFSPGCGDGEFGARVGATLAAPRRPPPRRARRPRASSRAGHDDAQRCHVTVRRRPSTSEHGAEPDAWGRQEERRPTLS